ncbi:unnamed protein product [Adineta ricciae]|uniref:Uncharacterized protein n=2 Tax=Adineta ricciae TaxID=249248 RepID=A0A814LNV1_ADIRI|nr:unnamed protein product [Adineta ricciae]
MQRVRLLCQIILSFTLIALINAQVDPQLCPNGASAPIPDPKWRPVPSRFEIVTEMVSDTEVMELSQAFSTQRDAIATNSRYGPVQFYWNFITNEQFEVLTEIVNQTPVPQCLRQVIGTTSETSVIQPNTLILKPSALLGFDARNQANAYWGVRYDGDEDLRGIPTNRFKSCFFLNDIKATVAVTYHVSDPDKFQGYLARNQSTILQIDVRVKNQMNRMEAYTYNVFRYIPNPSRREERQALETAAGVFCLNRTSTMAMPTDLPERISSNSEAFIPEANSSIYSTHGLYDSEYQFTRFDVWFPDPFGGPNWAHFTEIHDFATGLSYHYNHTTRQCKVSDINTFFGDAEAVSDQPNLVQMGSPQHLIVTDGMSYHYTGEKRCRDRVWCHVWIGEKYLSNETVQHQEWYWASSMNGEPLQHSFPVKMVWRTYVKGALTNSFETTTFNYRRNPMTIFEIDFALADCYRSLGPSENFNLAVLSFTIANDKKYPVFENLNYLRLHIFETLMFALFIRPIRISNLIVDQNESNDILVTFTLLDAAPRTGPVEVPIKESSLDTLIERLTAVIDSNALTFRARVNAKQIILRARPDSLNIRHQSSEKKVISTGPRITGLWLGFITIGVIVGAVTGFLVFKKLATA